ncbi:ABC transporter permease subunit [Lentibacter sp. XHP0401]|uniref:ABC transporter permease subunit n=1 Tax=Lentibacter sp. XHP0401 TaxID=2984334 RepID=UPI0021E8CF19|nr:ABC transporter permease subunit [Lentibacter sp. XHP0401]MCV2892005.1 ABC transporter permease subunit [Lentibacter sp. XHP0401]
MFDLYLDYIDRWSHGLWLTASMSTLSVLIGFLVALPIGFVRSRAKGPLAWLAIAYVNLFRGMPLLVLMFLVYYGFGQFSSELRAMGLWWFFRDAYFCGMLALILNTSAYQAEIIRGSLNTISTSVIETNAALNLTRWTAFRRVLLPIAFAKALPPLGNEYILMVKATSLLAIITVFDLMGEARTIFSETLDLGVYYVAAIHYLVLVLAIEWTLRRVEARFKWMA